MPSFNNPRLTISSWLSILALLVLPGQVARAQSVSELIAAGDGTRPLMHPDSALVYYQRALALDSNSYPALWRAGRALVDIAKQIESDDDALKARRDSLYLRAKGYAERAIHLDSTDADGHFVLALALGRLSRTRGGKERVRFGRIIYDESSLAIQLRPTHDGAHHILGAWNAEVKQLSGITKFFAKALMGGGFLGRANWDSATAHLTRAVELNPGYLYHHLELAQVYLDLDRTDEARAQLEAMAGLPDSDVLDPVHRRRASQLLEEIRKKSGR